MVCSMAASYLSLLLEVMLLSYGKRVGLSSSATYLTSAVQSGMLAAIRSPEVKGVALTALFWAVSYGLCNPANPPAIARPVRRAVELRVAHDLCDPSVDVRRQGRLLLCRRCREQAGSREQVRQLQPGDV